MTRQLRITLPAHEVQPGDLVVNPTTGFRAYSVFDRQVNVDGDGRPVSVVVWPAFADLERGLDQRLELAPEDELVVLRRIEHAFCISCGVDLLVRDHVATCSSPRGRSAL